MDNNNGVVHSSTTWPQVYSFIAEEELFAPLLLHSLFSTAVFSLFYTGCSFYTFYSIYWLKSEEPFSNVHTAHNENSALRQLTMAITYNHILEPAKSFTNIRGHWFLNYLLFCCSQWHLCCCGYLIKTLWFLHGKIYSHRDIGFFTVVLLTRTINDSNVYLEHQAR